ncbi:BadF/BadG/BcrA/BcrD ATPase family protein [Actinopolymorpha alba]|uniref:BadF/BadG/BcrA/BcrD ATPase family protein n=1 Tax=Actinopolymorpha alba TaxID=533267 RepID=UPI00036E00F8|nr:BadF/BadG/BcrA/BcrD ATPase family protein [Actinopolymorpha alba]
MVETMKNPVESDSRADGHAVVDVGKSATRIRLQSRGITVIGPGAAPEFAGAPDSGQRLFEVVRSTWAGAVCTSRITQLTIGSTFLPDAVGIADAVGRLADLFPGARISVFADGVLCHAAALGGPGSVVSAGTGVTVVGADTEDQLYQRDSWGPDLGDRGSAAEIGRAGLRLACSAIDGVMAAPQLVSAATRWLGRRLETSAAIDLLARPDRVERLANFAMTVCDLAADGDRQAHELIEHATAEVAVTCAAMARRIGDPSVVLLGRLTEIPVYRELLGTALAGAGLQERQPVSAVLDVSPDTVNRRQYQRWAGRSPLPD